MSSSSIKEILADERFQTIISELKPAIPVLIRMAKDQAILVLGGLLSDDADAAIMQLRREATEPEWKLIAHTIVKNGNAAARKAVTDRDFVVMLLWSLILSGGEMGLKAVTGA